MIHLRALLFDFDGVLVDTEPIHYRGFAEVVREALGVTLDETRYYERYVGFDDRDGFRAIALDAGRPEPSEAELAAWIAAKARIVAEALAREAIAKPGAAEFLRAAAEIYHVGVCSGALRAEVELGLERLGVRELVPEIVAAEDVERGKPDPEGYRSLLERLGARAVAAGDPPLAPHLAAVIEDTPTGLAAGREAGCWTVAVAGTEPVGALAPHAHLVLPDLTTVHPAELADRLAEAVHLDG